MKTFKLFKKLLLVLILMMINAHVCVADETFTFSWTSAGTAGYSYSQAGPTGGTLLTNNTIYFVSNEGPKVDASKLNPYRVGFVFKPTANVTLKIKGSAGSSARTIQNIKIDEEIDARLYSLYKDAVGASKTVMKYALDNASDEDKAFYATVGILKLSKGVYSVASDAKSVSGQTAQASLYDARVDANNISVPASGDNEVILNTGSPAENYTFEAGTYYRVYTEVSSSTGAQLVSFTFTDAGGVTSPSFSPATGNSLVKSSGTVTLTSSGNTVYYKWSQTDNQYASGAGATLAGAADGSGTSPVNATAPSTAGTWYLYAVAYDGDDYSNVVKATYTITNPTHTLTWNLDGGTATGGTAAGAVAEGATLTAPTVTKVGYDFAGWSPAVPATMPAADAAYTATWTKVYASGTYNFVNQGDGSVTWGSSHTVTLPAGTKTTVPAGSRVDNIFFSTALDIEYEKGAETGTGYKGWKIKQSGKLAFYVENDCDVIVTNGIINGMKIHYYNQSNVETNTNLTSTAGTREETAHVKGGTLFEIVSTTTSTNTLKEIRVSSSCSATANAGADKATTYNTGVVMAATAATSGYTGAWSIKASSPSTSTSQLSSISSATATFTPTAVGTYTLIWTVTDNSDGSCSASDEADVVVSKANISPSLSYTSTTLAVGDNSSSPTVSGNPGSGSVTYAVTASSPSGCITVNGSTGVVTANEVGTGTVTATVAATTNYNGNTCTANFTVNSAVTTYTVTYSTGNADSGSAPTDSNSPYTSGSTVTVLDNTGNLTKAFEPEPSELVPATFIGWNTNSNTYGGTHYDADDQFTISGNTTLYAVWGYPITYDADGGTINDASYPTYYICTYPDDDATTTLPSNVTKDGHTFVGWKTENGSGSIITEITGDYTGAFSGDHTLKAIWTEDVTSYTVTYDANGGSSAPSDDTGTDITLNDGSGMTGPSGRTTFMGWNTQADGYGTGYAGGTTDINANLNLYAIWGNTYSTGHVFAHDDSYRIVNGVRKNPAAGAVVTTDGTATGISNGSSILKSSVTGLTDVTISGCTSEYKTSFPWLASYIKIPTGQTLTFTVASGYIGTATIYYSGYNKTTTLTNGATSQSITSDATHPESAEGNFTSKTFNLVTGTNTFTCSVNNGYISRIEVSMTQLYTLTLDKNNSDASGSTSGSAYVEPNGTSFISGCFTAPTRTGYDVEGYYGEAGCTNKVADASGNLQASVTISETAYTNSSKEWIKGSGATLYAKWTPAVYTVTLDANGGTINSGDVTSYTYGVGATLPVAGDMTAPSGAVFLGWYDGATKVISISTTATGNKSYKAKWGYTLYDSYFYQTYATTNTSRDDLVANAGFPAYISTSLSGNRNQGSSTTSSVTTPHDFSALGTTSCYFVHGTGNVALEAVADVKTIRIYGFSRDNSKKMSITAKKVSGSGSDLSISDVNLSTGTIVEFSVNIAGASGYNAATYYDYTLSFGSNFCLWGIYVEKYTNVPVTGVSLNKSSTTLTVGDTEQLTATIAPANATNKAVTWTSSNNSAATVSSTGLITAKAAGETTITVTTSDGSYTATCDVTVEAFSCAKYAGKIFELEVIATANRNYSTGNGTEAEFKAADVTVTNGNAYAGSDGGSKTDRQHIYYTSSVGYMELKSNSGNWYTKLVLTKCALRNGDVIAFTQKSSDSYQMSITTTATRSTTISTTSGSYTVTQGDGLAGASTIYIWHASSGVHVKTLTITRPTSYVMTYNTNGGRDDGPADERMAAGTNKLSTTVPTRAGYVFKEWNSQEDGEGTGYEPGALYTMPASASELFAKWVEPVCGINVIASVTRVTDSKTDVTAIGCTGLMTTLNNSYQIQSSGYFGLTLPSNFQVGDIVTFNFDKGGTNKVEIFRDNTGTNILHTQNSSLSSKNNSVEITITQDMVTAGLTNTITMYRTSGNSQNHIPNWVNVKRYTCPGCMSPKSGVTTWSTEASDWIGPNGVATAVPDEDDVVYLDRAVTVGTDVTAHAKDVILGTSGTLTISSQGTMIAEHTIRKSGDVATGTSDLIIDCSKTSQGALIFENPSGSKQAQGTVNFYTRSYRDVTSNKLQWQYVGYPFASGTDEDYDGYYINKYDESGGRWIVMRNQDDDRRIAAWEGLAISGDGEGGAQLQGTFAPTTNTNVSLTHGNAAGENLVGNSWTAPIQLADMDASDFGAATATVYIFNTGRYQSGGEGSVDTEGTTGHTVGQWMTIPISSAKSGVWAGMKVIPAFQAFEVITPSATTLSLDYSKVVRSATNTMNAELHAPARRGIKAAEVDGYRIRVADSLTQTDMYLFEDMSFTTDFDNGWEGYYMPCDGRSAQLYAQTALGKMAVAALPDLEGTLLGFKPGKSSEYTFSFGTNAGVYYLNDIKTQTSTLMQEGYEYTFTWEDGDDTNRFIISATPFAKTTPTGIEDGSLQKVDGVQKVLYKDHMYIIRGGRVFDATGGLVK
jgi:hypothetical protein